MSTRLFLVRHAESIWNAEQRVQGQANPALSVLGVQQVASLAEAFSARPIGAIYSSPLKRARLTAEAIAAPYGLRPFVENALREIHLGEWQGRSFATLSGDLGAIWKEEAVDDPERQAPGGESLREASDRIGPALDEIVTRHTQETIVLVTHSIIGRVALCHLLGVGLELVPRLKLKVASISMVRIDEAGAVLERLGDISHLSHSDLPSIAAQVLEPLGDTA